MVATVNGAFNGFMKDTVNLDPEVVTKARSSRNWLLSQIRSFEAKNEGFPSLYTEKDIAFGSFARRTKIRPLDDVDIMICLKGLGSTYSEDNGRIEIIVPDSSPLRQYCHNETDRLNSRKIINAFVAALGNVPHYEKAEIKRTLEAATLKLSSYTWNFDIVPCFFTSPEWDGRDYYIIPDGYGNWRKTDPRKDRDVLSSTNQAHNGNVLNAIRVMKYWNNRPTAPKMPSYLLESIIVGYYLRTSTSSSYVDLEIPPLLWYIADAVWKPVDDLKEIQGDLNSLTDEQRFKISNRAVEDYERASEARRLERGGDHRASIRKWGELFGPGFPTYG